MIENTKQWLKGHWLWRLAIRPDIHEKLKKIDVTKPVVFYLGLPEHGNLGDQAIAQATEAYLSKQLPNHQLVCVPNDAVVPCMPLIKRFSGGNNLVALHGGGNLGDLWSGAESVRREIISRLKGFPIIQLPQSMWFNDAMEKELSQRVYEGADDLTLVAREKMSHGDMKESFNAQTMLVPDMVFTLNNQLPVSAQARHGVMTLFRADIEKFYNEAVNTQVMQALAKKFDRLTAMDTVLPDGVSETERATILTEFWDEMASHELIVTDRLHGMIFGLITRTPTVVLQNNNGKITATMATWLHDVPWIKLWQPEDGPIESTIDDVLSTPVTPPDFTKHFQPLDDYFASFRVGE